MAKILLYNQFDNQLAIDFSHQLEANEGDSIDIYINSNGGGVTAGYSMINELYLYKQEHKKPVNMTVTGDASSMGAFMLLFGDNVQAFSTSTILIHRASWGWYEAEMSEDEKKYIVAQNKLLRARLGERVNEQEFIKVTKKSFDDIFSMDDRLDVILTAKQAKKVGLIDKVINVNAKRANEIKARYSKQLVAQTGHNNYHTELISLTQNKNNMSIFDRVVKAVKGSEPETLFKATINDTEVIYLSAKVGESIQPIGETKELTGAFNTDTHNVSVVDNVITAVVEKVVAPNDSKIEALEAKIEALEAMILDGLKAVRNESVEAITPIAQAMKKANITMSTAEIPKANPVSAVKNNDIEMTTRERFTANQNKQHEAKIKERLK